MCLYTDKSRSFTDDDYYDSTSSYDDEDYDSEAIEDEEYYEENLQSSVY
jgi:hypothetical protein